MPVSLAYTQATSNPPQAILVDNKACNHAPGVHEGTGATLVILATKGRPQNKAHVEDVFGLLSQCAPPLRVEGETIKERAYSLARLCLQLFFAAMNMRPRAGKKGRSRIDIYREEQPTPELVAQAKAALEDRLAKQLAARRTLRERQDPVKRAYLDEALARLELCDPTGHVQAAIAAYNLSDIVDGVATYAGKKQADTLPDDISDHLRYLLGIIRNIAAKREGQAIAAALWEERIAVRERTFACLLDECDILSNSGATILDFVDKALITERELERYFWTDVVTKLVLAEPAVRHESLFERVARRIHTSYRVAWDRRQDLTRELASKLLPLAG